MHYLSFRYVFALSVLTLSLNNLRLVPTSNIVSLGLYHIIDMRVLMITCINQFGVSEFLYFFIIDTLDHCFEKNRIVLFQLYENDSLQNHVIYSANSFSVVCAPYYCPMCRISALHTQPTHRSLFHCRNVFETHEV